MEDLRVLHTRDLRNLQPPRPGPGAAAPQRMPSLVHGRRRHQPQFERARPFQRDQRGEDGNAPDVAVRSVDRVDDPSHFAISGCRPELFGEDTMLRIAAGDLIAQLLLDRGVGMRDEGAVRLSTGLHVAAEMLQGDAIGAVGQLHRKRQQLIELAQVGPRFMAASLREATARLAFIAVQPQARRYRQISQVLARHGLGFLISITGLERFVPLQRFLNRGYEQPLSRPEHVRRALEELGPTFIKLGQILSTRADLLPASYQVELAKLQDEAPPLKADVVTSIVEAEFGRPVDAVFGRFELVPLAAASIGQVHSAELRNGTPVVVKVQRPGVVEQIDQDLQILQNLAQTASRRWPLAEEYAVVGLVQEFAQTLRAETDYVREGHNAERFAANFAGDETVHIPRVFWEETTRKVLTLERIEGIKIDDLDRLDAAGANRSQIALNGARMVLKMVFHDRFFHADPHPGNFFIEPGDRIGVVDFGMVGSVGPRIQEQLVWALLAYTSEDPERQVDALYELGVAGHHVDRVALRRDVEHMRARYYGRPVGEIAIRPMVNDVLGLVRRHRLHLPAGYALLLKTVLMHENLVARLDPSFEFTAVLVPYARGMMLRHFSPLGWGPSFAQAAVDYARLGTELPQHLRRLLSSLERGDLELGIRPSGFGSVLRRGERIANRIVLGMIASAFVIALAVLLAAYHVRSDPTIGVVLIVGFVLASVLGVYVAWSILRSGRP